MTNTLRSPLLGRRLVRGCAVVSCLVLWGLAGGCGEERELCSLRRVGERVTQVSGDCRGADLEGVDLSEADTAHVRWGNTTCPDGTNSDEAGGTCQGHLEPDPCASCAVDERCREGRCVIVEVPDAGEDAPPSPADANDVGDLTDALDAREDGFDAREDAPSEGCVADPLLCDTNATCHAELDPPACQCNEGFEGDGEACRARPSSPCDQPFLCPLEADCVELPEGAYRCDCGPNLVYDAFLDECVPDCRALDFGGQASATREESDAWLGPAWTIEAWIYPRATDAPQALVQVLYDRPAPLWVLVRLLPAEDHGFMSAEFVLYDDGEEQRATLPGASIASGRWSHLSFDSFSVFHVNGVEVEAEPIVGTGDTLYDGVLSVGARVDGVGGEPWEGWMRDLRISNNLRYLGHVSPRDPLIADELTVGLWPLGEEEGSVIARDVSIHGRPLEVRGGEWDLCPANP